MLVFQVVPSQAVADDAMEYYGSFWKKAVLSFIFGKYAVDF